MFGLRACLFRIIARLKTCGLALATFAASSVVRDVGLHADKLGFSPANPKYIGKLQQYVIHFAIGNVKQKYEKAFVSYHTKNPIFYWQVGRQGAFLGWVFL